MEKTLHLEDNEFEIEDSIEKEYKIKLDPTKTIICGKCNGVYLINEKQWISF